MGIMLRRSDTISRENKARIQKELRMYDKLWDEDPEIQRIKAEARGKAVGKAEAKVEASQEMIVGIVEARFPELVDLAQERVEKIRQLEILNQLAKQIVLAPDEATARWTLGTFAA
jgi:cell division ATPase FtsA